MTSSRCSCFQTLALTILVVVGFLVLLPLVFLVEESLNVGDPMAFPPVEFGIANYLAIFQEDIRTVWNTLIIAIMATVMAIAIGFTLAWILTRTNVPGREKLERLMELPYYMTPLVGALAAIEDAEFVLQHVEQPRDIAVLFVQQFNDSGHGRPR